MSLNCKIQITIKNNITEKKAMTVKKALGPDNVDFPKNLTMEMENIDNKIILNLSGKDNIKSLISTIDEMLEHIQISLKVIDEC